MKLLAEGDAPRNLTVRVNAASAAARKKIEAAGGRVETSRLTGGRPEHRPRCPSCSDASSSRSGCSRSIGSAPTSPRPGIDPEVIKSFFDQMAGTVFALFNLFSGGALEQLSIFALGIMPYISASIILQLLTVVIPSLEQLQKEGEQGRRKITQYTRYGTVVIALFQGLLLAIALENGQFGEGAVATPGWGFRLMMMITLTTGTAFIMWLGEQITERGIGNGISLVIFAGIVVRHPERPRAALGAGAHRSVHAARRDPAAGLRGAPSPASWCSVERGAAADPDPARQPRRGPQGDAGRA